MGGQLVSSFVFSAERARAWSEAGEEESVTYYHFGSKVIRQYENYNSLPEYIRRFLQEVANSEFPLIDEEDLQAEDTMYCVEFGYHVRVSDDGAFRHQHDLQLLINGVPFEMPELKNEVTSEIPDATEAPQQPLDEAEQVLFDSIFSHEELEEIEDAAQQVMATTAELDIIETFRQRIADISTASTERHIEIAKGIAKELKRIAR